MTNHALTPDLADQLLRAFLATERSLPEISQEFNLKIPALLAWFESEETQSSLRRLLAMLATREALLLAHARQDALIALRETIAVAPDHNETTRKSAAAILRLPCHATPSWAADPPQTPSVRPSSPPPQPPPRRTCRKSTTNIGPPIRLVTTDSGTRPASVAIPLTHASASTSKPAPAIADPTTSTRCDGPAIARTTCGPINPTNPIAPASTTDTAVNAPAITNNPIRTPPTATPTLRASSSPSDIASIARPSHAVATTHPSTITPHTHNSVDDDSPRSPPMSNRDASTSCDRRKCRTNSIPAPHIRLTTTPTSTSEIGSSSPRRWLSTYTSANAPIEPTSAATRVPAKLETPTPAE